MGAFWFYRGASVERGAAEALLVNMTSEASAAPYNKTALDVSSRS